MPSLRLLLAARLLDRLLQLPIKKRLSTSEHSPRSSGIVWPNRDPSYGFFAHLSPLIAAQISSSEEFGRGRRRSWARLIERVYEADPLVCPRCYGPLKILRLIGDAPVIEERLRHLKLWYQPARPPPPPAGRSIQYDEHISGFDQGSQWPDASG